MDTTTRQAALIEAAITQGVTPLVITDADLSAGAPRVEYCNPAFSALTGYGPHELFGRRLDVLDGPGTATAGRDEHLRCRAEGRVFRGRLVQYRRDGSAFHADWLTTPVLDEHGVVAHFASICRDCSAEVDAEQARSRQVVDQAARQAQRKPTLAEASQTDPLTGLLTHQSGTTHLREVHDEASRASRAYSLLLGDVDHFNRITDHHGYRAGERVLVHVARLLRHGVRPGDTVMRWGGDTSLVVLPATELDEAVAVARRLRADAAATPDGEIGAVTLSIGVATWRPGETMGDVLARVDDAMFAARAAGGNRVEWTEQ
jgi:diguanylate cyclase (GGDEF)-like protein/PAS domain S-box-containing protein